MDVPRIKSVKSLGERRLLVTFVNGVQKVYDCHGLMHLASFQMLKNETFFKTVVVDAGGYGIFWNDDVDLSEYEVWNNGITLEQIEIESESEVIAVEQARS